MAFNGWRLGGAGLATASLLGLSSLALTSGARAAYVPPPPLLPATANMLPGAVAAASRPVGTVSPQSMWTFTLVLPSRNPSALANYAATVSTPGSPAYHHFLSRRQAASRFGPAPASVTQVTTYLTGRGFHVTDTGPVLSVTGRVGQVNQLFSTELTRFDSQRAGSFVAPSRSITVPPVLRLAESVGGLVTHPVPPAPMRTVSSPRRVVNEPLSAMTPPPSGPVGFARNGGLLVTARLLTQGARVPGMAVHYLVTATLNGQPDPNAFYQAVGGQIRGPGSFIDSTFTNGLGQFVLSFTLSQAQAAQLAVTVGDGTNSATVLLPAARFIGPSATTCALPLFGMTAQQLGPTVCLWNPATNSINTAMNANALVSQAGPGNLAVYTAGNVASISTSDVGLFAAQFQLPPPVVSVAYTGPNACTSTTCPGSMPSIEGELSLDLQMMETASPGAHIQVFEAGSIRSALAHAVSEPSATRPNVFSISYGAGDLIIQQFEPGAQQSMDMLAQMANVEGMTVVASAGDSGAYSGAQYGSPVPQPSYPASSAGVSALGGLEASVTAGHVNRLAMWGGNLGQEVPSGILLSFLQMQNMMASGGYSRVESMPFYQSGFVAAGMGRANPDVSLPASVVTPGYYTYIGGTAYPVGGTSAAAPLFAAYVADLDNLMHGGAGNINYALYGLARQDPAIFSPVAYGNNGVYSVTPRYNAATGLGGLNVDALASALTQFGA